PSPATLHLHAFPTRRSSDLTPQGEMIFTVMASLAQFESALISARVKAGMARARAQGKRISRAPLPAAVQRRIAALYQQGLSIHQDRKSTRLNSSHVSISYAV